MPGETFSGECRILKGLDQIRTFINPDNPIGRDKVIEMIKEGLPVRLIGNTYYSTTHNILTWFNKQTWVDMSKAPDKVLQEGE